MHFRIVALIRTTAVILVACLVTACKKEPARAALPSQPEPVTRDEAALQDFSQHISQFYLSIDYKRHDGRFTGVRLSVPPKDLPDEASGACGIEVVRISESTARRLVERLVRDRLAVVINCNECQLRGRAKAPLYWIAGSAGDRFGFLEDIKAGPEAEARIRSIAAVLEGEAAAAVRGLLTRIEVSETIAPALKSDLWPFELRLDPGPNVPRPRPALCVKVAPLKAEPPDVVAIQVPSKTAGQIIDTLETQGFFFGGTNLAAHRTAPAGPYYTVTVHGLASGPIRGYYVPSRYSTLTQRIEWLRRLVPGGEPAEQMDRFVEQLKSTQNEAQASIGSE